MINDVPCHAAPKLMAQLRAWGLDRGFLASDFCDIGLLRRHDAPGVTGPRRHSRSLTHTCRSDRAD